MFPPLAIVGAGAAVLETEDLALVVVAGGVVVVVKETELVVELVVVVVVVVVVVCVVVGFAVVVVGLGAPSAHSQLMSTTPAPRPAKCLKRPSDMSNDPQPQVGHSSITVAVAVFPFAVMMSCLKQCEPPEYWQVLRATIMSFGPLFCPQAPRPSRK